MFWKKDSTPEEVTLVLDIGSASVAASLVLFQKGSKPKIVYTTRIPISIPEKVDVEEFTKSMLGYVKKALEFSTTEGIKHFNFRKLDKKDIEKVVCVYASPWFASESKNIHLKEKEPIEMDEDYIGSLIRNEEKAFKEKMGITDEVSIVEKKIVSTKLNGYPTSSPYGKKAHDVEINLFLGVIPQNIISGVEKMIRNHIHPEEILHHSFSLIAYRTITNLFPNDSNSIIFDVTGEVTDISVIENDVITNTASVPIGRNNIVREVAKINNSGNELGLSMLHLYAQGKAEEKLNSQLEQQISMVMNKWNQEVLKIVPEMKERTAFLTVDEGISPIFKKYLVGDKAEKVVVLNDDHFSGVVQTEKNMKEDIFVSTIVLFLDDLFQL